MRSKIEANEYKDYILGFIFYKYLSDKEEQDLYNRKWNVAMDDNGIKNIEFINGAVEKEIIKLINNNQKIFMINYFIFFWCIFEK